MTQDICSFTLEIVASAQSEIHSIEWVEIESPTGSFLVGPDHMQLISLIKKRSTVVYRKTNSEERSIQVSGGIFKVAHNKAVIILEQ
ncbi:MAG: hypothetical protein WC365_07795 [Candidatus Babeliales bacterium]|jgi:F0F1-type ATP synthase epsilon subunit